VAPVVIDDNTETVSVSQGGSAVRADAQRNYDRILEVARQVFAERGHDASMDEIAKRSGVGPGTLYRHFPNRDTLYDALMKDWVARIHASADKAVASELPPREVLLGRLAGGMQAPVATLAGLFAAPLRNLGYALAQLAEQKGQATPEA